MFGRKKNKEGKKTATFLSVKESRAIEYIVREMNESGRDLFDVMEDPFVRNRIEPDRRFAIKQDEDLLAAFQAEIDKVRERMDEE
ncbi:MAG: hypothetical protein FWC81_01235 [Coriobacteriia bacterium]|nr:hypothetical protein [Coriobacteriia bacterium]MCL2606809.1 hypothetical protein [Coriobacteriia bacterium]